MSGNSREVVGVFHDVTSLEDAASTLMSNGFDRSGLTLIATEDVVRKELGSRVVRVEQLEDYSGTPRIAYVNREDLAIGQGALIGGLFYLGAMAGTAAVLMTGGAMLPALAVAAATGIGGGSLGALLASLLQAETGKKISDEIERGGLILWVRTHPQEEDDRAIGVMRDNGAYDVHAHADAGAHVEAARGRVVQTPTKKKPYKVILEHESGEDTEKPVSTMKEGEAVIKQATPTPPERDTSRDEPAPDA